MRVVRSSRNDDVYLLLPPVAWYFSEQHFPEKQPYSLEKTFTDLCDLAAKTLVIGGKVSFWFPVILERYYIAERLPS